MRPPLAGGCPRTTPGSPPVPREEVHHAFRSWRSRRIDGRALARLDVLGQGRLVLQLPPWATVTRGQVRPLEADLLARRYQLTGDADVDWRIPASALARSLLLLALAVVPFAVLRAYAGAVLRRKLNDVDKAHRLQGALLAAALLLPIAILAALFLGGLLLLPEVLLAGLVPRAAGCAASRRPARAGSATCGSGWRSCYRRCCWWPST
jgi:hypothetical protein